MRGDDARGLPTGDITRLHDGVLDAAILELKAEIRQRPNPDEQRDATAQAFKYATQTQAVEETKEAEEVVEKLNDEEHAFLTTLDDINQRFAHLANTDPAAFAAQQADPNSEYNRALADAMGLSPEKAIQTAQRVKKKVRRLIEVMEAKGILRFDYHCPFCLRVNSPTCEYWSQSEAVHPADYQYSREWLVEHSLKKPYTEIIYEKKQVVQMVDETVGASSARAYFAGEHRDGYVNWQ